MAVNGEKEVQIHESNPFKERYSCDCGAIQGEENLGQACGICGIACRLLPERFRNYKGYINDPRLKGPRALNKKEQAFRAKIYQVYNNNNALTNDIAKSKFMVNNIEKIIDQTITNCPYVIRRVLYPKVYETEIEEARFHIYQYLDYIIQGAFYPSYGERARDTLYPQDIEYYVENLTSIFLTVLIQHVLS